MAYPEICFTDLIGIRGICNEKNGMYFLDDIPGISIQELSEIADTTANTGKKLGEKLIESAARIMAADVEAIYDSQYKVENMLVNGCSTCKFLTGYSAGTQLGIKIKDNTSSNFTHLVIDKLVIKVNSTGVYTFVIDDGTTVGRKTYEYEFEAGTEVEFVNVGYTTKQKAVTMYFEDDSVLLAQLSCPRTGSGCGCSGRPAAVADLIYTGTNNGAEQQQAYGFLPCAFIRCDAQDLLCYVAKSAPRMVGMALLYKTAEMFFNKTVLSTRNNRVAGADIEEKKEEMKRYISLYKSKLVGKDTRGVKDVVMTTLANTRDVCVVCNAKLSTAWATT